MKRFVSILALFLFAASIGLSCIAEVHYFGEWSYRRDGAHRAECRFCEYVMYVNCSELKCEYDRKTLSVCPVCGHYGNNDGYSIRCDVQLFDYESSPVGEVLLMKYDTPFGDDSDIVCAYSVIFEHSGEIADYDGLMKISFGDELPDGFSLLCVSGSDINKLQHDYDASAGIISFTVSPQQKLLLIRAD